MKGCISAVYFPNIYPETVECQRRVVERFNVSRHPFYQNCVDPNVGHAGAINRFFERNRSELGCDVLLFLDIDCIPLCTTAIDHYLSRAADGVLVGNIQRSNHIENNEHVFVAPSALAISVETYQKLGYPSAAATERGDIAEEFTFAAEEHQVPVEMILPSRYDYSPLDCDYWLLKTGMPVYGCGSTFTHPTLGDLFWHQFQISSVGQQPKFIRKCKRVLGDS